MKIMVVADVHIRTKVNALRRRRTLRALKKAFSSVDCDMAVILGDLMHGPDYGSDKESYVHDLREALDTTGNLPFAYVFGNHDDECYMTKAEILGVIAEYKNSLTDGENYIIRRNGETLILFDSGSYYDSQGSFYDVVKPEVIEWAKGQIQGEKAVLFQHIIIPDIIDVIERKGRKCRFNDGFEFSGKLKEYPCPPDINTGELETLAPKLKAMVFGHDHKNSFECTLNGVRIIQCLSSGVNCYEWPQRPTVRLIDTETLTSEIIHI